jgi:hypothetical protein
VRTFPTKMMKTSQTSPKFKRRIQGRNNFCVNERSIKYRATHL